MESQQPRRVVIRSHRESRQRAVVQTLEARRLLSASAPFHGTPFGANQTIEAEDFDLGGEGIAFHDTTAADIGAGGSAYRKTAVDIQAGGSNGFDVGYTAVGEWLAFTVNIPKAGPYQLQSRVANTALGAAFHANFAGVNKTGTISIPNTGGWQTYQTALSSGFTLSAGKQVMKVFLDKATAAKAIGNFDWFKIVPASSSKLTWTTVAAAPEGLAEAQSAVIGGKMYVFGGFNITTPDFIGINHAYVYDPAANQWAQIADLPAALTHTGVASDGHYAYIAGGYISDLTSQELTYASTNVWRYDPQTDTYSPFVPLPEPRGAGAMVYLDGELHYFGGVDLDRVGQTEHWILNLNDADPEWTAAAPMPFTRNHLAAVVLNDHIYAIGGQEGTDDKIPDPDVLMYWDPSNPDQWTHVADLPAGRSHMAAISTGSHIIVMAGEGDGGVILSSTLEYDPTTNAWTQMTSMPGPRLAPVAEYINGKIVFALGYSLQGLQKTTWISNSII